MANIPNSVRVTGFIAPTDTTDTYPVVVMDYVKGGLRTVSLSSDLSAIPTPRLEEGMLAYVQETSSYYKLNCLSAWVPLEFGDIAKYESVYSTVNSYSANWNSTYTIINSNSANWNDSKTDIYYTSINETLLSGGLYNTVIQLSGGITTTLWSEPVSGELITIKNNIIADTFISGNGKSIEDSLVIGLRMGESVTLLYNSQKWIIHGIGNTEISMEQWTTVPATNDSVGYKGQLAFDGIYMYFCVSQNKWIKTTAITSF